MRVLISCANWVETDVYSHFLASGVFMRGRLVDISDTCVP
jgi:hypothetical protein